MLGLLMTAQAGLAVLGRGVRLASEQNRATAFLERFGLPCVLTWGAADLFQTSDARNLGILGVFGHERANAAMRQCDLLICLGTSLGVTHTGTDPSKFSPKAKIVVVDIDPGQLAMPTRRVDVALHMSLKDFFDALP